MMEAELKEDIYIAINIWSNLLIEMFQEEIEYIYAKGSAIKTWETKIDYVPQISDIDIHVKVKEHVSGLLNNPDLKTSIALSTEYRKRFKKYNIDQKRTPFHLPRIQLVILNKLVEKKFTFVHSRLQDVRVLFGNPIFPQELDHESIRQLDKSELLKLHTPLKKIPTDMLDRSDQFEYYTALRRITYVISPSPVRLLTQLLRDKNPYDIWTWNRTTILQQLQSLSLHELATTYEQYYLMGWELFNSKFEDIEKFQNTISLGLQVLSLVYNNVLTLR